MSLAINIQFDFAPGPWGGANQFVKALKNCFIDKGVYEEDASKADVILFNSDHSLGKVLSAKLRFKDKIFVHRLAGPMYIPRGSAMDADLLVYKMNELVADGTVFQSNWSKNENHRSGLKNSRYETLITNAPDKNIFPKTVHRRKYDKIKLIATSWSSNLGKGFDVYKFIDENLDFKRFAFTFVGRSPYVFRNITHIPPKTTAELVNILSDHDIFISASRYEACSNSVIEAMHCGLPAVVYNDSSNPEIIGEGGVTFDSCENVIAAIQKVAGDYEHYREKVDRPVIDEIGQEYITFCKQIIDDRNKGVYVPKTLNYLQYGHMNVKFPDFFVKRKYGQIKAAAISIFNVLSRKLRLVRTIGESHG